MQKLLLDDYDEKAVTHALEGLTIMFPNELQMVKTNNGLENIVMRKDVDNVKRVSIISGWFSIHKSTVLFRD